MFLVLLLFSISFCLPFFVSASAMFLQILFGRFHQPPLLLLALMPVSLFLPLPVLFANLLCVLTLATALSALILCAHLIPSMLCCNKYPEVSRVVGRAHKLHMPPCLTRPCTRPCGVLTRWSFRWLCFFSFFRLFSPFSVVKCFLCFFDLCFNRLPSVRPKRKGVKKEESKIAKGQQGA